MHRLGAVGERLALGVQMPKAVIFDIDGTLVDSVDFHAEAWRQAFAASGKELPFERIREQIGKGSDQLMPVFLSPEELKNSGKEIEERRGTIYQRDFLPKVRPFPGVRALFEKLAHEGKRLALASSAKQDELEAYKRLINVDDFVEVIVSADDVERSKPEPDIFRAAIERLALRPTQATVVGDTPYDAEAAARAGMASIGVLCGGFPGELLLKAGCRELRRDPEDLLARYADSSLAAP